MIAQTRTQTTVSIWTKKHPVLAYFILAVALSWSVELPLAAAAQGWLNLQIPIAIHYLAAFGPMLAGIVMTWVTGGSGGLKELWGRATKWRVGLTGAAFAILSPVALFALASIVIRLMGGEWPDLRLLGAVNYLPFLGIAVLPLWLATYGFGEEVGWRGFALPRLQKGRNALSASVILGLMWSLWHVPAFLYLDTYVKAGGLAVFPGVAFGIVMGAIVLTWLYNTTHGSVLMVAVWHALFDLFTAAKAIDAYNSALQSAVIMIGAVIIVVAFKPANLSRVEKHTL
jgi:membrane protease YdiL (CAAX protease family)